MAAYLSPVGNEQQNDANGAPLSGGMVYTYAAGTTTPIATYTDSAGLVAQENPVVLNSAGLPDSPIWLPAGQAVKLVVQDADGVTLRTVDNVSGINDPSGASVADQWVNYAGAPTYISATSFSLDGDQTNIFQVGRRVKSTNTGGTVYSSITASSYSAGTGLTTVTVTNDSGTLDSGMSQVSYGLLSSVSPSLPDSAAVRSAMGISTGYASTASSLKLPTWLGGFIFNWGSVTTNASGDAFAAFDKQYASTPFVLGSPVNGGGSGNATVGLGVVGTTGANFGAYQANTGTRIATAVYWFAIGK